MQDGPPLAALAAAPGRRGIAAVATGAAAAAARTAAGAGAGAVAPALPATLPRSNPSVAPRASSAPDAIHVLLCLAQPAAAAASRPGAAAVHPAIERGGPLHESIGAIFRPLVLVLVLLLPAPRRRGQLGSVPAAAHCGLCRVGRGPASL